MNRTRALKGERGAAAVEMALVLPVLLFVLMGLIDFGRAYNAQLQLSQAAREGARLASLGMATGSVVTRVQQAAPALVGASLPAVTVTTTCPPGASGNATVVVTSNFTWITGISAMSTFFGPAFIGPNTLTSTGVMQCAT